MPSPAAAANCPASVCPAVPEFVIVGCVEGCSVLRKARRGRAAPNSKYEQRLDVEACPYLSCSVSRFYCVFGMAETERGEPCALVLQLYFEGTLHKINYLEAGGWC